MNSFCIVALVFLMCAAIAGIGPENEVLHFWELLTGASRAGEPAMYREQVLCMVLLTTFLLQDLFPLELERRLATFLFGPNCFGVLLVLLFCLFDTSVDLWDFLEKGEFTRRDASRRTEDLLISATNLVLVVAHIKTYKLRYALQVISEHCLNAQVALAVKEEVAQIAGGVSKAETTLLGCSDSAGMLLKHRPTSSEQKKEK